ncbi:MAG TPA: hypothetical protein VEZ24_09335 [Microvirga sp.]|nr:hypothetical protein [Microvirga sp.]
MATEVIEADPHDVVAQYALERLMEMVSDTPIPSRALAIAMIANGGGAIAALDGREAAAQLLRDAADRIENPELAGRA